MQFKIKKLRASHIKREYIYTIKHPNTKKYIQFAKLGKHKKKKIDLINYLKKLPKNELLFKIFYNNDEHVANFKFQPVKNRVYIGFLTLNKYQGKGIFKKSFHKILKLFRLCYPQLNKLYLGVDKNNFRAISLYKRLGFKNLKNTSRTMFLKISKG